MILWSTAEAVLRQINFFLHNNNLILWSTAEAVLRRFSVPFFYCFNDPMVYCGSGTETVKKSIFTFFFHDPMVYCGSGTETFNAIILCFNWILWSTAEAVLRH